MLLVGGRWGTADIKTFYAYIRLALKNDRSYLNSSAKLQLPLPETQPHLHLLCQGRNEKQHTPLIYEYYTVISDTIHIYNYCADNLLLFKAWQSLQYFRSHYS